MLVQLNSRTNTEINTLSLHDALPICTTRTCPLASWPSATRSIRSCTMWPMRAAPSFRWRNRRFICLRRAADRKSTRLNSSHLVNSYAVFYLKEKKQHEDTTTLKQHG